MKTVFVLLWLYGGAAEPLGYFLDAGSCQAAAEQIATDQGGSAVCLSFPAGGGGRPL